MLLCKFDSNSLCYAKCSLKLSFSFSAMFSSLITLLNINLSFWRINRWAVYGLHTFIFSCPPNDTDRRTRRSLFVLKLYTSTVLLSECLSVTHLTADRVFIGLFHVWLVIWRRVRRVGIHVLIVYNLTVFLSLVFSSWGPIDIGIVRSSQEQYYYYHHEMLSL